ncbi:TIGR03899 family protein [Shewanella livingstonensis]|uniref:TIGR03899 family protein n=1 Tax=Shewanella livingstonensis TaxID=150120 RepID=A0A3G8LRZ9_9GAMM|nr:TIGR03899 family protein [Shewanella livingstonensis]AZG72311.1 TIGR03899 family protein [Shewanella livingstonensis]
MADIDVTEMQDDNAQVSARKKTLLLGRIIGLASEEDYRPSTASVAERAEYRQRKQLSQHQTNLESIFALAINYTPSDVTGVELDPDWRYQFFQMAEQIHNRKMQDLWARILASEIVNPGNFSLRTLAVLLQLTFREALIFEKALGMSVKINTEPRFKLLSSYRINGGMKQYFRKHTQTNFGLSQFGLPYSSILSLVDAGILHKSEFETGLLSSSEHIQLTMCNATLSLKPKHQHLLFTYYRFTTVGDELCQLIQAKNDNDFIDAVKVMLSKDFIVSD